MEAQSCTISWIRHPTPHGSIPCLSQVQLPIGILAFASSYPETQIGDSVSEILSYFFSRNLSASPAEIQRIIGGNMLELLPPRPPYEKKKNLLYKKSTGCS